MYRPGNSPLTPPGRLLPKLLPRPLGKLLPEFPGRLIPRLSGRLSSRQVAELSLKLLGKQLLKLSGKLCPELLGMLPGRLVGRLLSGSVWRLASCENDGGVSPHAGLNRRASRITIRDVVCRPIIRVVSPCSSDRPSSVQTTWSRADGSAAFLRRRRFARRRRS